MRWPGWAAVSGVQSGHRAQVPVEQERKGQIWPGLVTSSNIGTELHILVLLCSKMQAGHICGWEEKELAFCKKFRSAETLRER